MTSTKTIDRIYRLLKKHYADSKSSPDRVIKRIRTLIREWQNETGKAVKKTDTDKNYQTQWGPSYLHYSNGWDEFLADHLKSTGLHDWSWNFGNSQNTKTGLEKGWIDPETGILNNLPDNIAIITGPALLNGAEIFPDDYEGEWVLRWGEGEADVKIVGEGPGVDIISSDRHHIQFRQNGGVKYPQFSNIIYPFGSLTLKRVGQEDLLFNPRAVEEAKHYNCIRMLAPQGEVESPVTSWRGVAKPEDDWRFWDAVGQQPPSGRYGIPYEAQVQFVNQAQSDLWSHIPLMIGAPDPTKARMKQYEAGVNYRADNPDNKAVQKFAAHNKQGILESPKWERFARRVAKRMQNLKGDLYLELGNESSWNPGWPFGLKTGYCAGIGGGSAPIGQGILNARMIKAFSETEINCVFVAASQTANEGVTEQMLNAMQEHGVNFKNERVGVAVTTYHGGEGIEFRQLSGDLKGDSLIAWWQEHIERRPEELKKLLHSIQTGDGYLNLGWIVEKWHKHNAIAQKYGSFLLGAYEGGSHAYPPHELHKSEIFMTWWEDFHWGEFGADVCRQINKAIINEFPGTMIANYGGKGPTGIAHRPWYEGSYSHQNAMQEMWQEF